MMWVIFKKIFIYYERKNIQQYEKVVENFFKQCFEIILLTRTLSLMYNRYTMR